MKGAGPATMPVNMEIGSEVHNSQVDKRIARLLISACIFLYLLIFGILFFVATSNGASYDTFIGLNYGAPDRVHRDARGRCGGGD